MGWSLPLWDMHEFNMQFPYLWFLSLLHVILFSNYSQCDFTCTKFFQGVKFKIAFIWSHWKLFLQGKKSLFWWPSIVFHQRACQRDVCRWKKQKQVALVECFAAILWSLKPILFLLKQTFSDSCNDRCADSGQPPAGTGAVPGVCLKTFPNQDFKAHTPWDLNSHVL